MCVCSYYYMCPYTTTYVSLYCFMCPHTTGRHARAATSRVCGRIYSMRTHIYESRIYSTGITGMFVILYRYHRYVPHTLPEDIHEDGSGSAKKKEKKKVLLSYAVVQALLFSYCYICVHILLYICVLILPEDIHAQRHRQPHLI